MKWLLIVFVILVCIWLNKSYPVEKIITDSVQEKEVVRRKRWVW